MAETYKAPDIGTLSAHEFNKIRTSLDKYKATQTKPAGGFGSRFERSRFDMTAGEAKAAREEFKRGKGYGVEDEYRYMVSQGFRPESMQVAPQQQQAAAPVEEPKTGFTPTELDTGTDTTQQPQEPQGPDFAELFSTQIASMQQMFQQSMQQQQQQYMQMQQAQDERMAALQQQIQQSMIAQQQRPEVAGVKMAEGAAGTPMQIARRGVTGAFGRRGMRISNLNV